MADPRLFRLRVRYAKRGRLAMLSHLEVARALERAVRRAQLPFAVTQGFSPHMRIAFGAALPVGVGGADEFFDVFLDCYVPDGQALAALEAASPADLMPHGAAYVEPAAPAASVACPISTYQVTFERPVGRLEVPEAVEVVRKKKRKVLQVAEFLVEGSLAPVGDGTAWAFTLVAKPTGSLRPDGLLDAIAAATERAAGEPLPAVASLVRTAQNEGLQHLR